MIPVPAASADPDCRAVGHGRANFRFFGLGLEWFQGGCLRDLGGDAFAAAEFSERDAARRKKPISGVHAHSVVAVASHALPPLLCKSSFALMVHHLHLAYAHYSIIRIAIVFACSIIGWTFRVSVVVAYLYR